MSLEIMNAVWDVNIESNSLFVHVCISLFNLVLASGRVIVSVGSSKHVLLGKWLHRARNHCQGGHVGPWQLNVLDLKNHRISQVPWAQKTWKAAYLSVTQLLQASLSRDKESQLEP